MSDVWPNRWFGFWKEMPGYEQCPSIREFVDPNGPPSEKRLLSYLRSGNVFLATSALAFPNAITGELRSGSLLFMTDGVWAWPSDLAEYIEKHNVCLPAEFISHIVDAKYLVPVLDDIDTESLDMPNG